MYMTTKRFRENNCMQI